MADVWKRGRWILAAAAALNGFVALAQDSGGKLVAPVVPLTQVIEDGGLTMRILIVMSFLAIFMAIYLLLTLRRNVLMPGDFRREAEEIAERGDAEALNAFCSEHKAPGAKILGAATRVLHENPDVDYFVLRDVVEDEGGRQSSLIWQRIQYLNDIAKLGPLFGLFGTVWGMIEAFVGLKDATGIGNIRPEGLAAGVSKALVTTAGGLIVGILALILYTYFRGRAIQVIGHMEESCSTILQRFVARASRRVSSK